jgi:hypothetical protein
MPFRIVYEVSGPEELTTVIQIMTQDLGIKLIQIEHVKENEPRSHRYAHGIRNKGITGSELLMEALSDGKSHKRTDLIRLMVSKKFAEGSFNSAIGKLIHRDKKVVNVGDGYVQIVSTLRSH